MTRPSVLVADDDARFLAALRIRFEAAGFDVVTTEDAYQALEQSRRFDPDILILDINMPAGNGFSVKRRMEQIPALAQIPIIYITGQDQDSVEKSAEELGAYAILYKPLYIDELIAITRNALADRQNMILT